MNNGNGVSGGGEYNNNGEGLGGSLAGGVPVPPSVRVMQGAAGREQVREEVMRLLGSFGEQLGMTNGFVSGLQVRSGRRGGEGYAG